jgi:hypothetical protein
METRSLRSFHNGPQMEPPNRRLANHRLANRKSANPQTQRPVQAVCGCHQSINAISLGLAATIKAISLGWDQSPLIGSVVTSPNKEVHSFKSISYNGFTVFRVVHHSVEGLPCSVDGWIEVVLLLTLGCRLVWRPSICLLLEPCGFFSHCSSSKSSNKALQSSFCWG